MGEEAVNVLDFPSYLLKKTYQHPQTESGKFFMVTVLYTICFIVLFATVFVQVPVTSGNVGLFVGNVEALGFFTLTFGKLVIFGIKRNTLGNLLQQTQQFWTTEILSGNIKQKLDNMVNVTVHLQKSFMYLLYMSLFLTELHPYFTKQLPLGVWALKGHDKLYNVVLGIQEILIPFLVLHNGATDGLFVGFCMSIIIQFKILKLYLRNLDMENISKDQRYFNVAIKQHIFLLKYLQEMRAMYSPVMLVEYSSLVLVFCSELFILTASTDVAELCKHFIITMTVLMQLVFYCMLVDYVTNEASSVSYAVYESNWYSGYLTPLKNVLPILTQKAQKEITFTAGGFYDMNTKTLLNVLKMAWSICVALRTVRND